MSKKIFPPLKFRRWMWSAKIFSLRKFPDLLYGMRRIYTVQLDLAGWSTKTKQDIIAILSITTTYNNHTFTCTYIAKQANNMNTSGFPSSCSTAKYFCVGTCLMRISVLNSSQLPNGAEYYLITRWYTLK